MDIESNDMTMQTVPFSISRWEDVFRERFYEDGVAICSGVLTSDRLADFKARLDGIAARERADQTAWFSHGNQRIFNLINKDRAFLDLIDHPVALHMAKTGLGSHVLLSSITANFSLPGNSPQHLHADQGYLPEPWIRAETVNIIFVLDDFTSDNGATRIVPGSHRIGVNPTDTELATVPVIAPAGSLVCMDGRVWHGTGINRTREGIRRAVFAYYCQPYIRQQENFSRSLPAFLFDELSARQQSLLGFDIWMGLGSVNGLPITWMDGRTRIGPTEPRMSMQKRTRE